MVPQKTVIPVRRGARNDFHARYQVSALTQMPTADNSLAFDWSVDLGVSGFVRKIIRLVGL